VSSFRVGVLAAAVLAGPPLYGAVQEGGLDGSSAAARGAVIAAACVIGVSYLARLVTDYEAEAKRARDAADRAIAASIAAEIARDRGPAPGKAEAPAVPRTARPPEPAPASSPPQRVDATPARASETAAAPAPAEPAQVPDADVRDTAAASPRGNS
jgi:hypothetical protein